MIFNLKILSIFLDFKVSSESFFQKNFKTGLTFWNMWFLKIKNCVEIVNISVGHFVAGPYDSRDEIVHVTVFGKKRMV